MRKSAIFLIFLLVSYIASQLPQSFAGSLTQTTLRLSRQTPSTPVGGQLCTTTPSSDNGAETSVQIIFPTGFNVNQTTSNWSVDTSDIPATAIAWPGINTANVISGQTVTFPSSNLSSNTTYCFNFDSTNTLTTPSSTGNYEATIRTRNGASNIDSIEAGLFILANDGIEVTATVPASPSDFQAVLILNNQGNNSFSQNNELSYTLDYSSFLANSTSITVQAEWDLGIIQGSGVPTEDILDYVIGSATNGYNNTPPVVDTVNRTISWNISPIPANTSNQTVSFRLRTNDSYRATLPVSFSVHGRVIGPGTQTPDSTVTSNYYNYNFVTPTPTPTCVPGNCPSPTSATATPTPTPAAQKNPVIYAIDIRSISSSGATIFIAANKQVSVNISYGTSLSELSNQLNSPDPAIQHLIELQNLKPKTRYYFRVIVQDASERRAGSDIYVFDTASTSTVPTILANSLIVTSGDIVLTNYIDLEGLLANIILPYETPYAFRFAVTPPEHIKSIKAVLRPNNVLGILSTQAYADTHFVSITEISPGFYIGKLLSETQSGIYKLVLQVQDYNGNLSEQPAATLYIVSPLRVVNSTSKEGVENVKATLYFYNYRIRKYELLSPTLTAIKNPIKSRSNGIFDIVLPEGKYKAELSSLGYKSKTVEFMIGPNESNYPTILLNKLPFSIWTYVEYTMLNLLDAFTLFNAYIDDLKQTSRFLELYTFSAIVLFIILTFYQLSRLYGVAVLFLPFYIGYHIVSLFHKPKHTSFVKGKVLNVTTNEPIEGALIHFSTKNGKVVAHTRTNVNGEFGVAIKDLKFFKINFSRKGFTPFSKTISKEEANSQLTIVMGKIIKPEKFGIGTILWYFESLLTSLFEAFLVITLIIEILFAIEFGIAKALPCIIFTLGSILLWALHARPRTS